MRNIRRVNQLSLTTEFIFRRQYEAGLPINTNKLISVTEIIQRQS